jgi:hypothetical protein
LGQVFVGFDRRHVHGQPVAEPVRAVQVVDARLLDRLGQHPIDIEVDALGLGESQNLALDIGQPGRRQVVEIDVVQVAERRTRATASSTSTASKLPQRVASSTG